MRLCLVATCRYALCPLAPEALHAVLTAVTQRSLLGILHCWSTCLKDKKREGDGRAELSHEW